MRAVAKEIMISADIEIMDVKLCESLEVLKKMGKDQKQAREPLLKELVDRVFSDMLAEIKNDTAFMDLSSMQARHNR